MVHPSSHSHASTEALPRVPGGGSERILIDRREKIKRGASFSNVDVQTRCSLGDSDGGANNQIPPTRHQSRSIRIAHKYRLTAY
jgi:hypothetical protein